ncbi:MAG: prepilin-type N-terminal cleavage/methylation domain-containing protein [Parcubacteria group bacterium]|nr:prepilin-type N-terminal cleavage/methylation domain-containing protein [Parcubacteria group bacterium]
MKEIKKSQEKYHMIRGFTVFELLVTIGVFALLSALAIANFKSVDNSLILRNVASQVAMVTRKAQIYGISVKGVNAGGTVFPSYGVNFNTTTALDRTRFTLFADLDPDGAGPGLSNDVFDGACPGSECVQRYTLAKGYTIQGLEGPFGASRDQLNITFTRPNPDTVIKEGAAGSGYQNGKIIIQSKSGDTKTIVVWKTGQISVE